MLFNRLSIVYCRNESRNLSFNHAPGDDRLSKAHFIGDEKAADAPAPIKSPERALDRRLLKSLQGAHDPVPSRSSPLRITSHASSKRSRSRSADRSSWPASSGRASLISRVQVFSAWSTWHTAVGFRIHALRTLSSVGAPWVAEGEPLPYRLAGSGRSSSVRSGQGSSPASPVTSSNRVRSHVRNARGPINRASTARSRATSNGGCMSARATHEMTKSGTSVERSSNTTSSVCRWRAVAGNSTAAAFGVHCTQSVWPRSLAESDAPSVSRNGAACVSHRKVPDASSRSSRASQVAAMWLRSRSRTCSAGSSAGGPVTSWS